MSGPLFPDSYHLLLQEGFLIDSSIAQGLTALRNAHVGDKGPYYTGFFQLSIGLERLMKAIVILEYMAKNGYRAPTTKTLKGYGHNLVDLFTWLQRNVVSSQPHPMTAVHRGSIEYDILEHLSDFATRDRYFNLDSLASGQPQVDPLERWRGILGRILAEDVAERAKARVGLQAAFVASRVEPYALIRAHGLDRKPLSTKEYFELPVLSALAARFAIYRAFLLLIPLRGLLVEAGDRVMGLDRAGSAQVPSVPDMGEFLRFVWADRKLILRKKKWP